MSSSGNKYTRLLSNTVLFAISSFSSKILSFLLTRLYTGAMTEAEFGTADLVQQSVNFLIPLVSLGISNAVIRFGLEKNVPKRGVFTAGLIAIGMGFSLLLAVSPLVGIIPLVKDQIVLMYACVLVSCLRTLCCQFTRAKLYTRLYAIDGILSVLYTVGFNILFLLVLKLGVVGYLLAIICADFLSILGLTLIERLWRYVRFANFDWPLYKTMLHYCLPLVPALLFWWVTSVSDRYFIAYMRGAAENGLYAAAAKVPSLLMLFSTIFTEAWQLSAVTDGQGRGRHHFFSQVFGGLSAVVFLAGSGLVYGCKVIMGVLVAPDFFIAWRYVPILVAASIFSCFVAFLNSVYMVEKRSGLSLVTTMAGAAANLVLNALLIPKFGPNGAAFATFVSYLLVFVIRAVNTRRFIRIRYNVLKIALNTLAIFGQGALMLYEVPLWPLWCGIILVFMFILNVSTLYTGMLSLLSRRRSARAR